MLKKATACFLFLLLTTLFIGNVTVSNGQSSHEIALTLPTTFNLATTTRLSETQQVTAQIILTVEAALDFFKEAYNFVQSDQIIIGVAFLAFILALAALAFVMLNKKENW